MDVGAPAVMAVSLVAAAIGTVSGSPILTVGAYATAAAAAWAVTRIVLRANRRVMRFLDDWEGVAEEDVPSMPNRVKAMEAKQREAIHSHEALQKALARLGRDFKAHVDEHA